MSNFLEFQGKNVEQALEKASDKLNIPPDKIKHEVLTYGSTGIFGLVGIKKAKIKVFLEEKKKQVKREKSNEGNEKIKANGVDNKIKKIDIESELTAPIDESDVEITNYGMRTLTRIVKGITEDTEIKLNQKNEKLMFIISGGDSSLLIGKRGQTLEAIQYLLEKMINKKSNNRLRVMVDVEGYLEKRRNNLKQMASRMAEKVKRIKKPVTIGQMNAQDRRIVHIHLKDENGIRTQSVGDGYYRKLMIFPKKQGGPNKKNSESKNKADHTENT